MPNLSEISNGTKLILGAGLLLLLSTFFDWQQIELGPLGDVGQSAWGTGLGVIMGLALILLLAWVLIQVLNVKLNFELPITEAWLTLGLAVAVFALALLKNLVDDFSAWPSYVGVVLAALVAFGGWLRAQELGGIGTTTAGATTAAGTGTTTAADPGTTAAADDDSPAARPATMPEAGLVPGATPPPPPAPAPPPVDTAPPAEPAPADRIDEPAATDDEPPSRPPQA